MDIQIDTREKQRAIRKILKTFDDNGVKHGYMIARGGGIGTLTDHIRKTSGHRSAVIGTGSTQRAMLFMIHGSRSKGTGIILKPTAGW